MTFEDELRREREEVSQAIRREGVLRSFALLETVNPNISQKEVIHSVSALYPEYTEEEIDSLYSEYSEQLNP